MHRLGRRYRVLLVAEAANPEWQSVPLEGWNLSRALARVADVYMVTQIRNSAAISRAGPTEHREIITIDSERVARPLYRLSDRLRGGAGKGWTTIAAFSSLSYYFFEFEMWRQLGNRIRSREFDIVHRVTPLSPTSQSLIAKPLARHNIPFMLGPLNGGIPWPKHFNHRRHAEREWLSYVRALHKLMPGYRTTRRYSSAIIAGSKFVYHDLPGWTRAKTVYIPENGVDLEQFRVPRARSASIPLKAAFVGRLVPYKGADIAIEAMADFLRSRRVELHIIGDGPQRGALEKLVDGLKVRQNVHFHGWLGHNEVHERLRQCDFMPFPSVREFGGAVVVEAMALGVTPIVADYGGPSEHVDDDTGIRVGFTDEASLVEGMRKAIEGLIRCPERLDKLGAAGRKKVVEKLTWDAKSSQILAVYDAVMEGATDFSVLNYR
jgi:glycosyltransferase involved in cell wall biosynthesis